MQFNDTHTNVSAEEIEKYVTKLAPYIAHVNEVAQDGYEHDEAFLNVPVDKEVLGSIGEAVRDKKAPGLKYVVVIGMGGSNMGAKAVYDALLGFTDTFNPARFPKCVFLDTVDPGYVAALETLLVEHVKHPEEVVVNVVSKSGTTTETIANTDLVMNVLAEKWGTAVDRLVVTTQFGSPLWKKAEAAEVARLAIPEKVSGRYSVFSAAGLFPLAMCDINVTTLLEGAKEARSKCLTDSVGENSALRSAINLFLQYEAGRHIHNTFFFSAGLESMGKWYRQLMGESLGKDGIAYTPTTSIGPIDLHSVAQMHLGGQPKMVTTFVQVGKPKAYNRNISAEWTTGTVPEAEGKTSAEIMRATYQGVQKAYADVGIPLMDITLDEITPHELGAFMQMKMCEIMYLAKLLDVNAFDQPAVESYKEHTRNILSQNK